MMKDKFFNLDEMMVDYAEMSGFDFKSGRYSVVSGDLESEYSNKPSAFKYGNFEVLDMLKIFFTKETAEKA